MGVLRNDPWSCIAREKEKPIMNRNDAHRIARILTDAVFAEYDGRLVDNLIDTVEKSEQKFGLGATIETPATSRYEADNCDHCHASYGHKGFCPVVNRETAEAIAVFNGNPSEQDKIRAHALGVIL